MSTNKDYIYMDQESYEKFIRELESLQEQYRNSKIEAADVYEGVKHDAFETGYRSVRATSEGIFARLVELNAMKNRIKIIDKHEETSADIGDIIGVNLYYAPGKFEKELYELVAHTPNLDSDEESPITQVSINGPLGKAIYKKNVGDLTAYTVGKRKFLVEILEINKPNITPNIENSEEKDM